MARMLKTFLVGTAVNAKNLFGGHSIEETTKFEETKRVWRSFRRAVGAAHHFWEEMTIQWSSGPWEQLMQHNGVQTIKFKNDEGQWVTFEPDEFESGASYEDLQRGAKIKWLVETMAVDLGFDGCSEEEASFYGKKYTQAPPVTVQITGTIHPASHTGSSATSIIKSSNFSFPDACKLKECLETRTSGWPWGKEYSHCPYADLIGLDLIEHDDDDVNSEDTEERRDLVAEQDREAQRCASKTETKAAEPVDVDLHFGDRGQVADGPSSRGKTIWVYVQRKSPVDNSGAPAYKLPVRTGSMAGSLAGEQMPGEIRKALGYDETQPVQLCKPNVELSEKQFTFADVVIPFSKDSHPCPGAMQGDTLIYTVEVHENRNALYVQANQLNWVKSSEAGLKYVVPIFADKEFHSRKEADKFFSENHNLQTHPAWWEKTHGVSILTMLFFSGALHYPEESEQARAQLELNEEYGLPIQKIQTWSDYLSDMLR